jgi:hypothetical protein
MNSDLAVNEYRRLLKSLADEIERIRNRHGDDLGLGQKASGMVTIYQRILDLPTEEIWADAARRNVSLVARVQSMRAARELLKRIAAAPPPGVRTVDGRRLRTLMAGLPGDDPTSF